MKKTLSLFVALAMTAGFFLSSFIAPPPAQAISPVNLVINGDFETPVVTTSEKWNIFSEGYTDLGWQVSWLPGINSYGGDTRPEIANLELHRNVLGSANTGAQYTELDSDWYGPSDSTTNEPAAVKIYQDIATVSGATYELSFAWSARPNNSSSMKVYWNGVEIGSYVAVGGGNIVWNQVAPMELEATSTTSRLEFLEDGTSDSMGMFLDSVVLTVKELPVCYVPGKTMFASQVESYDQGNKKDGSAVDAARSVPGQGLILEGTNSPTNFFSLGFGGWIIASFTDIIMNGSGNDLKITEDTWGPYAVEQAEVYASQDGVNWVLLGVANNTNSVNATHTTSQFDLDGKLDWAKYVKVVDTSNPAVHTASADGYDLNAIEALSAGYIGECEPVLEISKTVNKTSLDRTYSWVIDKNSTTTVLDLSVGQVYPVNYTVALSATSTDSNWEAEGEIIIKNISEYPVEITDVYDVVADNEADIVCPEISEGPFSLPAGETLTCDYTVLLPDDEDRVNTATVKMGEEEMTASADIIFNEQTVVNEIDECVNVTDDKYGQLAGVCVVNSDKTLEYSIDLNYNTHGTYQFVNTASFITNDTGANGSDSYLININVPDPGCTLTQGYWKTHSINGPAPYDETWGGMEDDVFFGGQTYYQVLWTSPKGGNAYYQLAHQYIAAQLNIANDASVPAEVVLAWDSATGLFETYTPAQVGAMKGNNSVRKDFLNLASILASYNEGAIGPGHCSE